jgi:hypothetical protein
VNLSELLIPDSEAKSALVFSTALPKSDTVLDERNSDAFLEAIREKTKQAEGADRELLAVPDAGSDSASSSLIVTRSTSGNSNNNYNNTAASANFTAASYPATPKHVQEIVSSSSTSPARSASPQSQRQKICMHFNTKTCAYGQTCRFLHVCSECGSNEHPVSAHPGFTYLPQYNTMVPHDANLNNSNPVHRLTYEEYLAAKERMGRGPPPMPPQGYLPPNMYPPPPMTNIYQPNPIPYRQPPVQNYEVRTCKNFNAGSCRFGAN